MRKLILHMMTTTDGFIADPGGRLNPGWTNWDEEMKAFYNRLFATVDTIMYGRAIYQEMIPGWAAVAARFSGPVDDRPTDLTEGDKTFADRLHDLRKIVVSTTLDRADGDDVLIRDNLPREIAKIKERPGTDILLYCGPRLLSALTEHALIDEYMLYVHPTVIGRGIHLFRDLRREVRLDLLDTLIFGSGSILTRYRPVYTG